MTRLVGQQLPSITLKTQKSFGVAPRIGMLVTLMLILASAVNAQTTGQAQNEQWSVARASIWYDQLPWPVGFNYAPRYAINQLEMWQEDTFDPVIIDQELGWAAGIGFNMVRVFLHHLPWQQDPAAFSQRIDLFLSIADKHDVNVMFVLFDDVWNPVPQSGKQPEPTPGVHNSGWVQSPGAAILGDIHRHGELESYVRGILSRYGDDERVAVWDLYNEPGNLNAIPYGNVELDNKRKYSLILLEKVFAWARSENTVQPLTSGVWRLKDGRWLGEDKDDSGAALFDFMLQHSDIVTFHSYLNAAETAIAIDSLALLDRPMICTEYIARGHDSTFETLLPLFAEQDIGAIHWGFVSGKTQTIYPWRSWVGAIRFWDNLFSDEPDPWHHDLLYADGRPYRPAEVELISTQISEKVAHAKKH